MINSNKNNKNIFTALDEASSTLSFLVQIRFVLSVKFIYYIKYIKMKRFNFFKKRYTNN